MKDNIFFYICVAISSQSKGYQKGVAHSKSAAKPLFYKSRTVGDRKWKFRI